MLRYASEILRSNKQFVLNAVKHKGLALSYASKWLKDDFDIVSGLLMCFIPFQNKLLSIIFFITFDKVKHVIPFQ